MQNWVKTILRDVLLRADLEMGERITGILNSEFENNGEVRLCGKQREFYHVEYM